jgi:DNA-binding MarR family transcriptional regulator
MSDTATPQEIAEAVRKLDIAMSRLTGAVAREVGVSVPELLALQHLAGGPGLGPSELARRLQLTSGSITGLVDRLEAEGRAVRAPHPSDRRRVVVLRTPKADEDLRGESEALAEAVTELAGGLSEDERRVLARFLQQLIDVIERTADEACAA